MENDYRGLFGEVSSSVVIVEEVGAINNFCIGSVILNDGESTFILTQFKLLDLSANLCVRFSNGFKQPATRLVSSENINLCILITKFYSKCKAIEFFNGDINHNHTLAATIAPATKSSVYNLPCFIIQKSLEFGQYHGDRIQDGDQYFTFTCNYGDQGPNKESRIMYGPIFTMDGKVLGIESSDMREKEHFLDMAGRKSHEEYYTECSFDLKIGMYASALQISLQELVGDKNWRNSVKSHSTRNTITEVCLKELG